MPPKSKKTKAEEALDFLSNLDNLDESASPAAGGASDTGTAAAAGTGAKANLPTGSGSTPRQSTDSARPPVRSDTPGDSGVAAGRKSTEAPAAGGDDDEAAKALAFLEAQINTKRQPLTVPQGQGSSRPATPAAAGKKPADSTAVVEEQPANVPSSASTSQAQAQAGWGSSWWSTATSAIQSAQKIADEQYKKVRTEGVGGVTGQLEQLNVKGVDLAKLRKEAEERFGGIVKNVDLEKLRQELYNNTSSALNNIINTVAPPISAHETLELWLSHPMTGYGGVEGVVYRAWMAILEQTESGELVIVWSPPESSGKEKDKERGINQVAGFEEGWKLAQSEVGAVKAREEKDPKGRKQNGNTPVTTIPIFLHLQPVLAPLSIPEPTLFLDSPSPDSEKPQQHLQFILSLQDPTHNLRFTTISQPVPADWLEVEYDQSEWVEERLVDVIRIAVEIIAQDYVATRMALKPSVKTRPATPKPEPETKVEALPPNQTEGDSNKDD